MRSYLQRGIVGLGALLAAVAFGITPALAEYPEKPIKVIVGFSAGGATDTLAKLVTERLSKHLGQAVVTTNIDGAGGAKGTAAAAKAKPDGYTLVVGSDGTLTVGPQARNTGYTSDDFVPIGLLATVPSGFAVREDSPFKTLQDLVAYLKANPKTKYTSVGTGSGVHLEAAQWADAAGVDIVHIGNRGGKGAIVKLLSGEVTFIVVSATNLPSQIKEGSKLRPLAVTSGKPWEFAPSIPTLKSLGYDLETYTWWGLFAPKGTPADALKKLEVALKKTMSDPDTIAVLKKLYYTPEVATPAEIEKMIKVDLEASHQALSMLGMLKK